jgi:hypothetical protein
VERRRRDVALVVRLDELRDPHLLKDPKALEDLANSDEVLAQPPANVLILCYLLDKAKGKAAAAQLLRRAQAHYPTDFWLNFKLAMHWDLNPATLDETIGFLRAALALRPQSPGVHQVLGITLWYASASLIQMGAAPACLSRRWLILQTL